MPDDNNNLSLRIGLLGGQEVRGELRQMAEEGRQSFQLLSDQVDIAGAAMERMGNTIQGAITAYLGEKLHEAIDGAIEDLASLEKTAEKTGLTVQQVSAMRAVVVDAGGTSASADSGLAKFTEQLGQAEIGTGRLLPILKDLGIELKEDGQNRNVVDILLDYTNAIKNAASPQEALFLATKAFTEEMGGPLSSALKESAGGLEELAQKAKASSQTVDEETAKTAEDIERQFATAFNQVKIEAEVMTVGIISALEGMGATINDQIVPMVNKALSDMFDKASQEWKDFENSDFIQAALRGAQSLSDLMKSGGATAHQTDLQKTLLGDGEAGAGPSSLQESVGLGAPPQAAPRQKLNDDGTPIFAPGSGTGTYGSNSASGISDDADRKREDAIQKQIEQLQQVNENMQKSDEYQQVFNALKKNNVDLDSEDGQIIKQLVDYHIQLVAQQQLAHGLAQDFSTSIENAVMHTKSLAQVWSQLGTMLESTLMKSMMAPLTQGMAGGFNSLLSGLGWSGAAPAAQSGGFGFAEGGVMTEHGPEHLYSHLVKRHVPHGHSRMISHGGTPVRRYAAGGIADSPQTAIYGEGSMPEAFVPLQDGRTIPVTMNGGGSGPSSVQTSLSVTVINNAGAQVTAQKSASGQGIEIILQKAVGNMISSGKLDQSMQQRFNMLPAVTAR